MASSKHLRKRDLLSIKRWIIRVKKHRFKPKKLLKIKAKRSLKLPYKMIGSGKKRIVYDLRNGWVLKVAIAYNGLKNNKREVRIYRQAPLHLKRHLAKVISSGDGWLIMRKYKRNVPKRKGVKFKLRSLERRFKRRGILAKDLFSRKRRIRRPNIRLGRKGRIMIIDYGNFKRK